MQIQSGFRKNVGIQKFGQSEASTDRDQARRALVATLETNGITWGAGLIGHGLKQGGISVYVLNEAVRSRVVELVQKEPQSKEGVLLYQGYAVSVEVSSPASFQTKD